MHRNPRRVNLSSLKPTQTQTYRNALDVVSLMRRDRYSLASAARESGISRTTVKRYASSALTKRRGRYRAREFDRLPRDLYLYNERGRFEVRTRSSKAASRISSYHHAIRVYVHYGDASLLREFDGKTITVGGKTYRFLDLRAINRLIRAGEIAVHDIYAGA